MAGLSSLTLSEMRAGLDRGSFTSLDLTRACLENAERFKDLNAFITLCPETALSQAAEKDALLAKGDRSPLLGIPLAIKDLILTKGVTTTAGSKILNNFIPPYDATVTTLLKQAGAVIIGKTNLDEFGMGSSNENSAFGPVKNPWDTARVPGGSSGGSAVAVAAGIVPVALGTDTGGSIRQPASFCSIVGIRPTYGRVSRYGVVAYASSLDQVGTFARTVRDAASILTIISGLDRHDSTSVNLPVPNYEACLGQEIEGLRIGIPKEFFIKGTNPEVEQSVRAGIAHLTTLGAVTVEVSLPALEYALACYYIIAPAEASSNLSRYDGVRYGNRASNPEDLDDLYSRSRSEGFGKEVKRRILIGSHVLSTGYYDAYYLHAQKVRSLIAQDFKRVFEQCDIIACPVAPTTAFKIGEKTSDPLEMYLSDIFTIPVNLAGLPGMSLPCGFDGQHLPIGMQLIGKPFDEGTLLKVGHAFESTTDWHKQTAKVFAE